MNFRPVKRKHDPNWKMFVDECHVTSVNQGLFSTTTEAEKRDPGNEIGYLKGTVVVRTDPVSKEIYRRKREKISWLFHRFGHADVTKICKTCAIQALCATLVLSLRAALKLKGASIYCHAQIIGLWKVTIIHWWFASDVTTATEQCSKMPLGIWLHSYAKFVGPFPIVLYISMAFWSRGCKLRIVIRKVLVCNGRQLLHSLPAPDNLWVTIVSRYNPIICG